MDATTITAVISLVGVLILGIIDLVKSRKNAELQGVSAEEKKQNMLQALIDKSMELNKQEFDTMKQVNEELRKQITELKDQVVTLHQTIELQTIDIARLENVIIDLQKELRFYKKEEK